MRSSARPRPSPWRWSSGASAGWSSPGETSGAAVDRLGIPAFLIGPEIAPGVPLLRTVGDAHGGLIMALKSGNFGGEAFFGTERFAAMR